MNKTTKSVLTFVAGLLTGGVAMKVYRDYKFKRDYVEVVEDTTIHKVIEVEEPIKDSTDVIETDSNDVEEHEIKIKSPKKNIIDYTGFYGKLEDEPPVIYTPENSPIVELRGTDETYPISPDEFEEIYDYDSDEYTIYNDGYVTDSIGQPIDEEETIRLFGENFMDHFGEHDDNQIWLRNEKLKMDFSIIKDLDNFAEVAPPRMKRLLGID